MLWVVVRSPALRARRDADRGAGSIRFGKGTQARLLAASLGVSHLSVGTLLRTEIASHSARGDRVAATVAAGELVATDDVVAVLRGPLAVSATVGGWVLDGAPRTAEQAATLAEMIEGPAPSRAIVIALDVPEDELEPASFVGRGWRQERTTTPW